MATSSTVVLAISRQLGSGGSYIGQGVARRLGLKYVDREILKQAATLLGREDEDLAQLEERVANAWVRLTRHLSLGPPDALFTPPRPASSVYEEELFRIERQVIRQIAARENCVVIGRAAAFVLKDHPGLVRLFVHAPEAWRIETLRRSLEDTDRKTIQEMIRRTDRDRANFVHVVCGCDWSNACHYDMTINPALVGLDAAVDIVTTVVEKRMRTM
jgi:cytidylate kinase